MRKIERPLLELILVKDISEFAYAEKKKTSTPFYLSLSTFFSALSEHEIQRSKACPSSNEDFWTIGLLQDEMSHRSPNLHDVSDILVAEGDTSSLPIWNSFHDKIDHISIDPTDRIRTSQTWIRRIAVAQEKLPRQYLRDIEAAISKPIHIMGE